MNILAVDDEPLALKGLVREIMKAEPGCEMQSFLDPVSALESIEGKDYIPDVVFLDIEMPGMSGMALTKRLAAAYPHANIVFVTSHSQYALDAYGLHASGYLIKPAMAEDIRRELDNLRRPTPPPLPHVRVQAFGNFDVFVDGKPLAFKRSKAKEALAYLISKNGGNVSAAELAAILWEEKEYSRSLQNQTQTIISEMMKTLRLAGADEIVLKNHNSLSIDETKVDCDYYHFLKREPAAVKSYMGEFMNTYSWAEMIAGYLDNKY